MTATIGICLATFNGARFLAAQLDSIAAQSFTDWHLYARDDGSVDGTLEILADFAFRYPDRMTILRDGASRLGARENFARLLDVLREPYVAFSDQDDLWRPWKLALALGAMRALEARRGSGQPAMVHADRRVIDAEGREIAPSYWGSRGIDAGAADFGTSLAFCLAAGATMLVNRALVERALPLPRDAWMHDTWIELTAHAFGAVTALDEIALDWRRHGANATGAIADTSGRAARRPWARAARLFRDLDRQRGIYAGYLAQAEAFRRRFGKALDPIDRLQLDRFVSLPERSSADRFLTARRFGIAPPGLARRLVFAALTGRSTARRQKKANPSSRVATISLLKDLPIFR